MMSSVPMCLIVVSSRGTSVQIYDKYGRSRIVTGNLRLAVRQCGSAERKRFVRKNCLITRKQGVPFCFRKAVGKLLGMTCKGLRQKGYCRQGFIHHTVVHGFRFREDLRCSLTPFLFSRWWLARRRITCCSNLYARSICFCVRNLEYSS